MKWYDNEDLRAAYQEAFEEASYACEHGSRDFEDVFKSSLKSILKKSEYEAYSEELYDDAFLRYHDLIAKYAL